MNDMIILSCGLLFGLVLLYYGADWLVRGGSAIATRACVSPLVIGLTLVAFGTSAPELFVSVGASMSGLGDICVGNVVGSNIFNVLGILGVSSLVRPVKIEGMHCVDFLTMVAVSGILWLMMAKRRRFGRAEGTLLLVIYAAYLVWMFRLQR